MHAIKLHSCIRGEDGYIIQHDGFVLLLKKVTGIVYQVLTCNGIILTIGLIVDEINQIPEHLR